MADQTDTSEAENKSPAVGDVDPPSSKDAEAAPAESVGSAEKTASAPQVEPAQSAPAAEAAAPKRPSNIVIGLCLAVIGVFIVAVITLFTPTPTRDQDIPYLLGPIEKQLDAHVRYKRPSPLEQKDWRNDFVVEQNIWTNEVSKIILGRPDAKPIEFKRDYLLYLGDSYFKDEPKFAEAKAAYLTANATPRIAHANGYDYGDDELWRRLGYCDTRLGFYGEAENWLKKALKFNEEAAKTNHDVSLKGTHSRILDNLAENYIRMGQPKKAEELIQQRLRDMSQPDPKQCVEVPVLLNYALLKEREGDLRTSEVFYKLAITQCEKDDAAKGPVVPQSINDNNRTLARVLMNYSHMLRLAHRNDEAIATMTRALCIYDNPPS